MSSDKIASIQDRARLKADQLAAAKVTPGGLICSDKGAIKACEHNARLLIEVAPEFAGLHFDEFRYRMRVDGRDWLDGHDIGLLIWLQSRHSVPSFTLGQARHAAQALAFERRRDSLRDFIESLPPWDGTQRIESTFTEAWGAADDALTRAASRNLYIAMIARALRPGAQVDQVWSFEGHQGTCKSQSMRELGREFHAEITAPIGTADFMRELRGVWLAEMSELDSLRGREASTVKRLLSAPVDRFVEKYQAHAASYQRRAIAVATTNEVDYWQDPTGARRLIPIRCTDIRVDLIAENRLQWFAEALQLYRAGATWWEFPAAITDAQDSRQQIDPWEDTLRGLMARGRPSGVDGQGSIPWPDGPIASADIMRDWLRLDPHQQGRGAGVRIGHVMRRLGFMPVRMGHARERGWQLADTPTTSSDEVSAQVSA